MSIAVNVDDLRAATASRPWAYLLTVGDDGRSHLLAAVPTWRDATLLVEAGKRTRDNAARQPSVALVYPPVDAPGETSSYSLIVDAEASLEGDVIILHPTKAVLHRPAIPPTAQHNP